MSDDIIRNGDGSISTVDLSGIDFDISPAQIIVSLARAGHTNEEIAVAIGMTPSAFAYLLSRRQDLKDLVMEAKEEPNFKVEQSLFRRATGYQTRAVTVKAGKPVIVTVKEIAPDPISCIFWLKNRSPKKWRDIIEHRHTLRDRMERAHDASSGKMLGNGKDE